ncbi:Kinesin [Phytophthora megakarya]|uniref:Kinesin-like protein n=1 Tax=Phytophthora megakarya TaxID=4795 RepID=A0A225WSR1_9STRA|nr:Kinesin [Phytophthora megakarya]
MGSAPETRAGIRVCARFRPQNKLEQKHQAVECVRLEDDTAAHVHSEARGVSDASFTFDQVFGTQSSQLHVYEATAKPLVESALRGYNCTCFVYGQTGSGKTFSMEGVPGDKDYEGIIPRVMSDIFGGIQNMQADLEFIVRVSYVEIYMEKIRDLLKPSSTNLNVRESRERGVWIAGATEICCASAEEMQSVMRLGGANRVISSTRMNNESSRSHSVFIITIEQRNTTTGSLKGGKLFLVDLAGSEKVGKTHAKGQTLKEAQHINKSLSALGSVMNALTSGNANTHIPYRDSKLTRLLQDSLGGNSETTLLVCASSSSYNSEETISTLRFGTRAKSIKNKPKVNEERTVAEYKILVAEKEKRIATLEALLREAKSNDVDEPVESTMEEQLKMFAAKVEELEDEQASKAAEISSLEERNEDFKKRLTYLENELEAKAKECDELNQMLERLLENELLHQQLTAKTLELKNCKQRVDDLTKEEWKLDDEVFPVAPINMESEVVKRLIKSMPERGQVKLTKWLGFVLEGRDIRSNFHPEISIEGISEEKNRDMRRLIVPLLKNRHDLKVQSYVRTRYVRVSDLKISLDHKHKDEVQLESTGGESASDDGTAENTSVNLWAKDHLFYGPKSDASSPSVLHTSRVLSTTKDQFTSDPVDLSVSVTESISMLESPHSAPILRRRPSLPFDSFSAPKSSGGVFSRLRSKAGVGLLGDVKTRFNARYHKKHVHGNALCDGCGMSPIIGGKWKCNTCDGYELCDGCYAAGIHGFEVSNELCRRVEQLAVQKYRLLGEYPELFELFRRHICQDNVIQFRRVVEWICSIVSGSRSEKIYHKMIVKSGLHPDIRARLVAQLGALSSERSGISLKTEWFVERTAEEEATDLDDCDEADPTESPPVELDGDKPSPTNAIMPPIVQLETLRMYVMDATSSNSGDELGSPAALSDLLDPCAKMDADVGPLTLRRTVSAESAAEQVDQLSAMPRQQPLDMATYDGQRVRSVTRMNM